MGEITACRQDEQTSELMSLALDDRLDAEGHQQLEAHLSICSACQATWDAMQRVSALLASEPVVGPPLGFALRVQRRLEANHAQRRTVPGGAAILTGSLSLAGATLAAMAAVALVVVAWSWLGNQPSVQQGGDVLSQVASGMGLVGKGASLFIKEILVRYGPPVLLVLLIGLVVVAGAWASLFAKRPGNSRRNGTV